MNYNIVVVISLIICVIISFALSYFIANLFLNDNSDLFKVVQLLVAIITATTTYSPIKNILLKYMNIEEFENENKDN